SPGLRDLASLPRRAGDDDLRGDERNAAAGDRPPPVKPLKEPASREAPVLGPRKDLVGPRKDLVTPRKDLVGLRKELVGYRQGSFCVAERGGRPLKRPCSHPKRAWRGPRSSFLPRKRSAQVQKRTGWELGKIFLPRYQVF